MRRDVHYEVEEDKRTVAVTEEGVEFVEDQLGIDNLYEAVNTPLVGYLNNALKAKELYKKDKDYIVVDGEVDRKSTRLNSSHANISYAVFCLKKLWLPCGSKKAQYRRSAGRA